MIYEYYATKIRKIRKKSNKKSNIFWYVKKLYYLCTRKQQPMAG